MIPSPSTPHRSNFLPFSDKKMPLLHLSLQVIRAFDKNVSNHDRRILFINVIRKKARTF